MTQAAVFLGSLGRAVSVSSLYAEGHPTLVHASDAAWRDLQELLAASRQPTFTFLGDTVLFGDLPLPDHRRFEWSERFAEAGVQRVQFDEGLTRPAFDAFLAEIAARLSGHAGHAQPPALAASGVRFGAVGLRAEAAPATDLPLQTATLGFRLDAEIEGATWVHRQVADHGRIPLFEVEAIVRSLSVAMHADPQMVLPLVTLKEFDQYTTTHSLNVSVLAMGLADRLGLRGAEVRAHGIAGLLHDIGKTIVPREILDKPGRLTDAERAVMNLHPEEGAKRILRADEDLGLAAIVAYEHHVMLNGGGYPRLRDGRACHRASRVVHVCDVFDALRTNRPYRDAWPLDRALRHLREGAGTEFDPQLVEPFVAMIAECGLAPAESDSAGTP